MDFLQYFDKNSKIIDNAIISNNLNFHYEHYAFHKYSLLARSWEKSKGFVE